MYIIAGSTGTLGSAISSELSTTDDIFLIGRDELKLKEQSDKYNCKYEVIDLANTPEPRDFSKIISEDIEIKGLVNCIGSILIKPLHVLLSMNSMTLYLQIFSLLISYLQVLLDV